MNSKPVFALLTALFVFAGNSFAQDAATTEEVAIESTQPAYEAVVNANYVHVRGRPSIYSQIFGQVSKGDRVTVLENITRTNLLPDEPAEWTRIELPFEASAWVSDNYVDPASNTVTANLLNVRSGPGPEYGIVTELHEGDAVTIISTKDGWLEIKAPEGTVAYIAKMYLEAAEPGSIAATEEPTPEEAETPTTTETVIAQETPEPELIIEDVPATETEPLVTETFEEIPPLVPIETFEREPMPAVISEPLPEVAEPVVIASEEMDTPRIVTREGIVGDFVSITAPTYFKLSNVQNKATMNYIFTENPRIDLKELEGRRVVVKGEEFIHKRWPGTPVLKILELKERQ